MKILQVVNGYPPQDQAGTELCTCDLSNTLVERGHEVHVFCREANRSSSEFATRQERIDGVQVTRMTNNILIIDNPMMFYKNPHIERVFSSYLTQLRPDVVHVQHCIGLSASLLHVIASARIPCVMTLHDFWFLCERIQLLRPDGTICPGPEEGANCVECLHSPEHQSDPPIAPHPLIRNRWTQRTKFLCPKPVRNILKAGLVPQIHAVTAPFPTHSVLLSDTSFRVQYLREALRRPRLLVTPSRFVKEVFVENGVPPERIRVVPHGVKSAAASRADRETEIRLLFMGVIMPHKGLHVLLEAFRRLDPHRASLEVWGCPTPEHEAYFQRLRQRVEGLPVTFHGRYENAHLPQILSSADLLVVPSVWKETFSVVAHEAFTARVPVAAPSIGVFPEIVQDGRNGILFSVGDADDLASRLDALVQDPGRLREFSRKLPAVKGLSEHAAEMEDLYREVMG